MRVTQGNQFGQIDKSLYFQAIIFWKTLNGHYSSTVRDLDLIPNWELGLSISHHLVLYLQRQHFLQIETVRSSLHNHSLPQSNAKNYKFETWIGLLFCLQTSYHIYIVTPMITPIYYSLYITPHSQGMNVHQGDTTCTADFSVVDTSGHYCTDHCSPVDTIALITVH